MVGGTFTNRELGALGERLVAYALKQRGCEILGRNVRTKFGEIDIIARQKNTVLFVEVKTRRSRRYGYPEEAVDFRKKLHLSRASAALAPTYARNCNYAILVVAVELDLTTKIARLTRIELDA
ncbi:MAG: YraN family protein [Parcubacteria group bacterium]